MLGAGIACLALTLCNAAMYYGDVLYGFLPIVQKVSLVLWVSWLFSLSLRASQPVKVSQSVESGTRQLLAFLRGRFRYPFCYLKYWRSEHGI